ncbi:MAG: (2Fe-2S) ferredoxin domain-containing protein [Ruminiclostridium sp.]
MTISVCIGSSCHVRGSYKIVEKINKAIKDNSLEDKVKVNAAFCLGKCSEGVTEGVSVKFDDEIVTGITENNFDEIFNKYILQKV